MIGLRRGLGSWSGVMGVRRRSRIRRTGLCGLLGLLSSFFLFDGLSCCVGWWTECGIGCGGLRYESDELEVMLAGDLLLDKRADVRSM